MQQQQHPVFKKYRTDWLHEKTGYSKVYLLRVASGNVPLSRAFVERVSFALTEPADQLFILDDTGLTAGNELQHA